MIHISTYVDPSPNQNPFHTAMPENGGSIISFSTSNWKNRIPNQWIQRDTPWNISYFMLFFLVQSPSSHGFPGVGFYVPLC